MNWLTRFWYQDLPNEMQRKMLEGITSLRYRVKKVWYVYKSSDFDLPTADDVLSAAELVWLKNAHGG